MTTQRVSIPVMSATIPWDTSKVTVCLEADFISQLLGLGQILKYYRMWDGSDEEIQAMMANIEQGLQDLMTDCCPGVASIASGKGGYTRAYYTDGSNQIISNDYSIEQIQAMPTTQADGNVGDKVCAGVKMLSARLWDDILYSLDQADFVIDETKLASEAVSALLGSLSFFGVPIGLAYEGFSELISSAAELSVSALRLAFSDPAVHLAFEENLYCAIMATPNNKMTETIYFNAAEDLPLLESTSTFLANWMDAFGVWPSGDLFQTVLRWYNLGALSEDPTCQAEFGCLDTWCVVLDFTVNSYAAYISGADKLWTSGQGYVMVNNSNSGTWSRHTQFVVDLAGSFNITSIQMVADRTLGAAIQPNYFRIIAGATDSQNNGANGSNVSVTMATPKTGLANFYVSCRVSSATSSGGLGGAGVVKRIIINGTGSQPEQFPVCP